MVRVPRSGVLPIQSGESRVAETCGGYLLDVIGGGLGSPPTNSISVVLMNRSKLFPNSLRFPGASELFISFKLPVSFQ